MSDPIENKLEEYLVKNKEKRRSSRRSSVSSQEAMKLLSKMQAENFNENDILTQIADYQYNFIQTQYDKFKEHEKCAKMLAQRSTAAVKLLQLNINSDKDSENKKLSFQEQYDRDYALLDDRQRKFIEDSEISQDLFLNVIKKIRRKKMQTLCDSINDTTIDKDPKDSFLTKKQSRLSFSSALVMQNKSNESKRGIADILEEYFEC